MTQRNQLILLVDDEEAMRESASQWLSLAGFEVETCSGSEQALRRLSPDFPGILVTDIKMPGIDGLTLMRKSLETDADLPVILMTGHGDVTMAVEAMREGAYDFIEKPFPPESLVDIVQRALDKRRLVLENRVLRAELSQKSGIEALLIGQSPAMVQLRRTVAELADTPVNVLVHGETGSGKEQVARGLHHGGRRAPHPLVAINCAAMPESIFESELFGHEAGAFTGALKRRQGKLEYAHRGTVFLDEIETMPMSLQVKLLRVLQEREVGRLGSNELIPVDFRVVAATKTDLLSASQEGAFREDLYYRLNVAHVHIPPLRDRREDIPRLFEYFCHQAALAYECESPLPSAEHIQALLSHNWPGNVRELRNVAERFVVSGGGKKFPLGDLLSQPTGAPTQSFANQVATFEKSLIETELARHSGNIQAVMEAFDMPRRTLNDKMLKYGLLRKDFC